MHLFAHHMPAVLVLSPDSREDAPRRQALARRQQGNERKLVTIVRLRYHLRLARTSQRIARLCHANHPCSRLF